MIWPWLLGALTVTGVALASGGKDEQLPRDLAIAVTQAKANPTALGYSGLLSLAKTLDARGFPKSAARMRVLADRYAPAGAAPTPSTANPTMPSDLAMVYTQLKANPEYASVESLTATASRLEAAGFPAQAAELRALALAHATGQSAAATPAQQADAAAQILTAAAQAIPAPTPSPVTSSPGIAEPIQTINLPAEVIAALPPELTPPIVAPTAQVSEAATKAHQLSQHLNLLVRSSGSVPRAKGKEDKSLVRAFQSAAGLSGKSVDGLYGPGTAKLLARYEGDVPIVFWWPKGEWAAHAVPPYRAALAQIAQDAIRVGDLQRSAGIYLAAAREKGQGFGSGSIEVSSADGPDIQAAARTLAQYAGVAIPAGQTQIAAILQELQS